MTHNYFSLEEDFVSPFLDFLKQIGMDLACHPERKARKHRKAGKPKSKFVANDDVVRSQSY